ncbi:MAG: hypothetical protein K0Q43_195 [Ramlibacter sp.]|jgi:hypothetical protein|nr:hypothetical protein [Ramlibacter sp.]
MPREQPNGSPSLPEDLDLSRVLALRAIDTPQDLDLQDRLLGSLRRSGADRVVMVGGGGDRIVAGLVESGYAVSRVSDTDDIVNELVLIRVSDWIAAWSGQRPQ